MADIGLHAQLTCEFISGLTLRLTDYAWADMVANMDYIDVGLTMLTWVYTLADRVYSLS